MPHSGGGGSHGGGSHGGSHGGGSSSRTSHTYFPGARRYRRHYNDGRPDEYFYTNGRPQKTGLFSIICMLMFGGIFTSVMFVGLRSSVPKALNERYDRPDTRIVDNIGIIDNGDEIEEVLEEINDNTGICPILYTMYTEDYEGDYVDLESFAYNQYIDSWSDEQHYLVVYAVPEDQAVAYMTGEIDVPDFRFEVMMGDETDPIITEAIENAFVDEVYSDLERGKTPGETFLKAFGKLSDRTEAHLSDKKQNLRYLVPIGVMMLVFVLPVIAMIKSYIRDKHTEIEEVPLTEADNGFIGQYRSSFAGSPQTLSEMPGNALTVVKVLLLVFMAPFVIIGITQLIGGINALANGDQASGLFRLIFGIIWSVITVSSIISIFTKIGKTQNKSGAPMTADYPKADMPHADYPEADYPSQEYGAVSHDACHSTHEEDEDSVRKGYE